MEDKDREAVVKELGSRLAQAARASVAEGAFYEPGEHISTDAPAAWTAVAETLVKLFEREARDNKPPEKTDEP